MFGNKVTDYSQHSIGDVCYTIAIDMSPLNAKEISGVQIDENGDFTDLITTEYSISELQSLINDLDAPEIAYAVSGDIFYLLLHNTNYPYSNTTRFVLYGKRYALPITSIEQELDIRETEIELFINYVLREAALYKSTIVDPAIDYNIQLLESQLGS